MRRAGIFVISFGLTILSCEPEKSSETAELSKPRVEAPNYTELWVMRGWQGYMGVMIGLDEHGYDYYFYSDIAGADVIEPLSGSFKRTEATLTLESPSKHPEAEFYSKDWRFVREGDEVFLASVDDLNSERDSGRWLRPVNVEAFRKYYDPQQPFLLLSNPQMELEIEKKSP